MSFGEVSYEWVLITKEIDIIGRVFKVMNGIYSGSFDPPTLGHLDVIVRAAPMFETLNIGIGVNSKKEPMFSIKERRGMLWSIIETRRAKNSLLNVGILEYEGLLVNFCERNGINTIVRGLRAVTDFESEIVMAHTNRKLCPEVDTMFLAAETEHSFVSSSMVKEVLKFGGDVKQFVPAEVYKYLKGKNFSQTDECTCKLGERSILC